MSDAIAEQAAPAKGTTGREERKIIFASSLGTVFEWYDFFLYGALAIILHVKQCFGLLIRSSEPAGEAVVLVFSHGRQF